MFLYTLISLLSSVDSDAIYTVKSVVTEYCGILPAGTFSGSLMTDNDRITTLR